MVGKALGAGRNGSRQLTGYIFYPHTEKTEGGGRGKREAGRWRGRYRERENERTENEVVAPTGD